MLQHQLIVDECAPPRREHRMLLARDVLVAEEQDLVLEERAVEVGPLVVGDRGEVDIIDERAESRADRRDGDVQVRRLSTVVAVGADPTEGEWPGAMAEHAGVTCHRAEL